jgi:hypothetical protein
VKVKQPSKFRPGDTVRLTRQFAHTLESNPKGRGVDWAARRGVVKSCNRSGVLVIWPGRTSTDALPFKAVERADA